MQIKWKNVFGVMFLVFLLCMFIKVSPMVIKILEEVADNIVYFGSFRGPTLPVMIIGMLCVSAVAIVKIISRK